MTTTSNPRRHRWVIESDKKNVKQKHEMKINTAKTNLFIKSHGH